MNCNECQKEIDGNDYVLMVYMYLHVRVCDVCYKKEDFLIYETDKYMNKVDQEQTDKVFKVCSRWKGIKCAKWTLSRKTELVTELRTTLDYELKMVQELDDAKKDKKHYTEEEMKDIKENYEKHSHYVRKIKCIMTFFKNEWKKDFP